MDLEAMGDLVLHTILSNLTPKDTAIAACVSNKLKSSASADILWSKFCSQELDLNEPIDPLGNPTPSFKACYQAWLEAFSMYPWPLVMRVKRSEATLCKGVSEVEIQKSERILKLKLPLPTRILYRFCDGQEFKSPGGAGGSLLGLIGGYSFYTHLVNVFLLPLNVAVLKTKEIIRQIGLSSRSQYIVVAASYTESEKVFFLNCITGQLHVGTVNLATEGEMIPCVPNVLISSVHDSNENGMIKLREERGTRSISLFPEEPPFCSTAITNRVKVRASAVFVPEIADLEDERRKYTFSYSIRMSLLSEGCVINGIPYSSCQLQRRHWIICANDRVESDVNDEAVIGQFTRTIHQILVWPCSGRR
ncbi:hypothetical protein RGQ29_002759 [Quercus rubra]|uniref:ApaG domain-containing protein n=1 Tax=Quercus rubra TaxID=3512 RepID=A0AAN7IDC0_QUERU|nr:hypothetical protein RGQ29_002759 [Quercus rubra]